MVLCRHPLAATVRSGSDYRAFSESMQRQLRRTMAFRGRRNVANPRRTMAFRGRRGRPRVARDAGRTDIRGGKNAEYGASPGTESGHGRLPKIATRQGMRPHGRPQGSWNSTVGCVGRSRRGAVLPAHRATGAVSNGSQSWVPSGGTSTWPSWETGLSLLTGILAWTGLEVMGQYAP